MARPSKWGNPYRLGERGLADPVRDRVECVTAFLVDLTECVRSPYAAPHPIEIRVMAESLHELRDRDLACWCRLDQPCHADALLALANEPVR